jgi:hypothetical protein
VKINIEQRVLRVPQVIPGGLGVDTLRVPARVYNRVMAIHPSINHPGAGIWAVTWAPTGQGVVELPTEGEAECFVLELLKDVELGKVRVEITEWSQTVDVAALTRFVVGWGERRKMALPRYLAKVTVPEGILVTGWQERKEKDGA